MAAARAKEINPNVHVQYLHGDVNTQLGLGIFRRMDVVIGCLDNREARLSVNRYCYWMNKPWVDGAIQEFLGLVRVLCPVRAPVLNARSLNRPAGTSPCDIPVRFSPVKMYFSGKFQPHRPAPPSLAQCRPGSLKIIHGLPVEAGKVTRYNGMTNELYTSAYQSKDDCESHWIYGDVIEIPARANLTTLDELLHIARAELGPDAVIDLDQEVILSLECSTCKTNEQVLKPISQVSFQAAHCPVCGNLREIQMTHTITGDEPFLHLTLASVGVPALHILRAYNSEEYRFFELTGTSLKPCISGTSKNRSLPIPITRPQKFDWAMKLTTEFGGKSHPGQGGTPG